MIRPFASFLGMRSLTLMLTIPMVAMAFSLPGMAQSEKQTESHSLAKKQQALLQRTARLKSMMKELLVRYTKEGREDYVRILKDGLAFLDKSGLEETLTQAWSDLNQDLKSRALASQTKVLTVIEELLARLMDRRSLEGLEKDAKDLEAKLATLSQLQKRNQRLEEKRKRIEEESRSEAEKKLQKDLLDLANEQRQMANESASQSSSVQDRMERALNQIRQMRRDANALDQKVGDEATGKPDPSKETADKIRNAAIRASMSLGTKDEKTKSTELEKLAKDATALAKETEKRALETADKTSKGRRDKALDKETARLLKEAAKKFSEAAEELNQAKQSADAEATQERSELRTQEGLTRLGQAMDRQRRRNRDALTRAKELARKGDDLADDLAQLERDRSSAGKAARAMKEANKAMERVEEGLRPEANRAPQNDPEKSGQPPGEAQKSDPKQPREPEERESKQADPTKSTPSPANTKKQEQTKEDRAKAREALARAEKALAEDVKRMQQNAARESRKQLARQQQMNQRAKDLQSRMEQARQQGQISSEQEQQAKARVKDAEKAMQSAEKNLSKGSPRAASRAQAQAAQKLQEAAQKMKDARKPGPQQKQAMNRLAEEQQKLQRDIQDLAKRINAKKNPQASRHLEEAAKQAQKAQEALQANDPKEAEQAQAKTKEELEKAKKELQKERDQYLSLRQEELLFKIAEELESMIASQGTINRQTLTLMASAGEKSSRGLRSQVRQLGRKEGELADRSSFLSENLAKEETLVFTYVLDSIATDLKQLRSSMSKRRPVLSEEITDLQNETLEQMKWLLQALRQQIKQKKEDRKQEQKKSQEDQKKPENTNQGQNKKRLVPDKAELMLLRRLEMDVRQQIQGFLEIQKELGSEFESMNQRRLNRLALKHAKISDLFKEFVESRGMSLNPKKGEEKKDGSPEGDKGGDESGSGVQKEEKKEKKR